MLFTGPKNLSETDKEISSQTSVRCPRHLTMVLLRLREKFPAHPPVPWLQLKVNQIYPLIDIETQLGLSFVSRDATQSALCTNGNFTGCLVSCETPADPC